MPVKGLDGGDKGLGISGSDGPPSITLNGIDGKVTAVLVQAVLNANGQPISSVQDPANPQEASTKNYVDTVPLDASRITSGRFGMARLPDGDEGQVLVGMGAGLSPAYADPRDMALTQTLNLLNRLVVDSDGRLRVREDGEILKAPQALDILQRLAIDAAGRLRVVIDVAGTATPVTLTSTTITTLPALPSITTFPYGQSEELKQRSNVEFMECQRNRMTF